MEKQRVAGLKQSQVYEFRWFVTSQQLAAQAGAQEQGQDGLKHKASSEPGAMEVGSLEEEEQPAKEPEGTSSGRQERGDTAGLQRLRGEEGDFREGAIDTLSGPNRQTGQGGG